ncbi:MAG: response regulator [Geobacter sp.]|nr:response regulator [Geobacter sp.]
MESINILLVEDNEDDRFLTIRTLRKQPVQVNISIAKNGDEALKTLMAAENDLPDLVLLDLQLPKIGGTTLLAKIREKHDNNRLPILILTSSDNPADINICLQLGISGYLSKPLDAASLGNFLNRKAP